MASDKRLRALIDTLLAGQEPAIRKAFLDAMQDARSSVVLNDVIAALQRGDIAAAAQAMDFSRAFLAPLDQEIGKAYFESGRAFTDALMAGKPSGITVQVRFDPGNPRAADWLRQHSSALITEIIEDQRSAVREALGVGMDAGRNPRTVALDVVGRMDAATKRRSGGIIGLTSGQADSVERARAQLLSGDPGEMGAYLERKLRDRRFDKIVRQAIREGRAVAGPDVQKIVARYSDRMLKYRGDVVARTEALTALSYAQDEASRQLIEASGLRPDQIVKTWRSRADGRTRESHIAMNGQKRPLQEPFQTPSGARLRFPRDSSLSAPPSETIQCFAPWVKVGLSGLVGAVAREYTGDLVELTVAGEVDLSVTPNHPILTDRGWVLAGEIMEGDHLLYGRGRGVGKSTAEPDVGDAEASAEEIYRLACSLSGAVRAARVGVNFHGEVPDEDVYVVPVDSRLRLALEVGRTKRQQDVKLTATREPAASLVSVCPVPGGELMLAEPAGCFVGGASSALALIGASEDGGTSVSFRDPDRRDPHVGEAGVDHCPSDAERLGYAVRRPLIREEPEDLTVVSRAGRAEALEDGPSVSRELLSAGLDQRRVAALRRRHYRGPVYNFESVTSILLGNGIVNHNCRCYTTTEVDWKGAQVDPAQSQAAAAEISPAALASPASPVAPTTPLVPAAARTVPAPQPGAIPRFASPSEADAWIKAQPNAPGSKRFIEYPGAFDESGISKAKELLAKKPSGWDSVPDEVYIPNGAEIATQDVLKRETLSELVTDYRPNEDPSNNPDSLFGAPKLFQDVDGSIYILDGHHRLVAARLVGRSAKVKILRGGRGL